MTRTYTFLSFIIIMQSLDIMKMLLSLTQNFGQISPSSTSFVPSSNKKETEFRFNLEKNKNTHKLTRHTKECRHCYHCKIQINHKKNLAT